MKKNFTFFEIRKKIYFYFSVLVVFHTNCIGQKTSGLGDPASYIYTMTSYGYISEINSKTAATNRNIVSFANYTGGLPSDLPYDANAMGYSVRYGKFYFLKRNIEADPQAFVSFDPFTNSLKTLKSSTLAAYTALGCVSYDGSGYYAIDSRGNLNFYDIASDSWTTITSKLVDQSGNNISSLMDTLRSGNNALGGGDMAIDGLGNLWCLISSESIFGLYQFPGPLPTKPVSRLSGKQIIAPSRSTPDGRDLAGIAFDANGKIFMSSAASNLYRLDNLNSITFIGSLGLAGGQDLTSLNFPSAGLLPVTWKSFTAHKENTGEVLLNWSVMENQSKGFYVQRSIDGNKWTNLSFVQSRNISEEELDYTYSYTETSPGKQYYRIAQVDADGSLNFSPIGIITIGPEMAMDNVWPNPARDRLYIRNNQPGSSLTVQLYDLSGRKSFESSVPPGIASLDIHSLAAGIYIVKEISGDRFCRTQKLAKQ